MNEVALRALAVTGILFIIGFLFILMIGIRKDLSGEQRKGLWIKYGVYILIVNSFLIAVFAGRPYFYPLLLLLVVLGLREFFQMLIAKGINSYGGFGMIAGVAVFTAAVFKGSDLSYSLMFMSLLLMMTGPILQGMTESAVANVSSSVLGVVYASFMLTHLVFIYDLNNGSYYVAFLYVLLAINDSFSELFGRSIGKRSIWPRISPNKTYAGSICGLLSTVAGSIAFRFLVPDLPVHIVVFAGTLIGICGQLGDLIASAFKRDAAIKDFGRILPFHGGVLDRFDSLFFSAPVFYYFLILMT